MLSLAVLQWGWYGLSCLFLVFVNIGLLWHGTLLLLHLHVRRVKFSMVHCKPRSQVLSALRLQVSSTPSSDPRGVLPSACCSACVIMLALPASQNQQQAYFKVKWLVCRIGLLYTGFAAYLTVAWWG